jgi:hypothetical protein
VHASFHGITLSLAAALYVITAQQRKSSSGPAIQHTSYGFMFHSTDPRAALREMLRVNSSQVRYVLICFDAIVIFNC